MQKRSRNKISIRLFQIPLLAILLSAAPAGFAKNELVHAALSAAQPGMKLPQGWSRIPRAFHFRLNEIYCGPGKMAAAYQKDFNEFGEHPAVCVLGVVRAEELGLRPGADALEANLRRLEANYNQPGGVRAWFELKNIIQDSVTADPENRVLEYSFEALTHKDRLLKGRARLFVQDNGDLLVFFYGAESPVWRASAGDRESIFAALTL